MEIRLTGVEGEVVEEVRWLGMLVEGRVGGHGEATAAEGSAEEPEQRWAQGSV